MEKIGGRDLVFNKSFIVPNDETLEFSVTVHNVTLIFNVTFEEGDDKSRQPITWTSKDGIVYMSFYNWAKRGLLSTMARPFKLGDVGGNKFGFSFSCTSTSNAYVVQFQILTGGTYDE